MTDGVSLVLVDFDDTLVETGPRFHGARDRLFARLEALGIARAVAQQIHHDEVDPRMLESHGLGPGRLPHSFRQTYVRVCETLGLAADAAVAAECAALGEAVRGAPPALSGALDALRRLAARHPTVVYTQAGDEAYQLGCVRESGVTAIVPVDRVHICRRKTQEEFVATMRRFGAADPRSVWMVGNSIRSDINPALSAGARAILVEIEGGWVFDAVEPVSPDFARVRSFVQAVELLVQLPQANGRPV